MACAVDHLAATAAVALMVRGGTAADAAVGASAVLAVTSPHLCGMGGDLFALVGVERQQPVALNASGRAGSGADASRLRAEGHRRIPPFGDVRSVPVPGCVDGWLALHGRYGRLPLAEVLAPAVDYARSGFPASPTLVHSAGQLREQRGAEDLRTATRPGAKVVRPGVADALQGIADGGRGAFYAGPFGQGLLRLGRGEYSASDLTRVSSQWVAPVVAEVWGQRLWSLPPNSQGYLTLAAASVASRLDLPRDTQDPLWAHLLIEATRTVSADRVEVLWEGADPGWLLAPGRLSAQAARVNPAAASDLSGHFGPGGTIYLCVVDRERCAVSLMQSNAMGFGSGLVEPTTGIFLQNRGIGFSLEPGHPAEYGPGRRPPSTLCPALVTGPDLRLHTVLGTMGGDTQPQILLQLLARLFVAGQSIGDAVAAGRWALSDTGGTPGFTTWHRGGAVEVHLEDRTPTEWRPGMVRRGHHIGDHDATLWHSYGHAHAIRVRDDLLEGASDPRTLTGAAVGY